MELDNVNVALLATNGFEESEMTKPREALQNAGATVHLISPASDVDSGKIKSWDGDDWGSKFEVDKYLEDVTPSDYDALMLPGGQINPDKLRNLPPALDFVKAFFTADKPIGAICHAPWLVVEVGAARGRRMTSYSSIQTDVKNAGADWVDEEVVVDGNLVTSRNPGDLPAFCKKLVQTFSQVSA